MERGAAARARERSRSRPSVVLNPPVREGRPECHWCGRRLRAPRDLDVPGFIRCCSLCFTIDELNREARGRGRYLSREAKGLIVTLVRDAIARLRVAPTDRR